MATKEPTLKMYKLTSAETKGILPETSVAGIPIRFKMKSYSYRYNYYGYGGYGDPFIKVNLKSGPDGAFGTIKAQIITNKRYKADEITKFLDWVDQNCSWHNIKVKIHYPYDKDISVGQTLDLPQVNVEDIRYGINGHVHLAITSKQASDVQNLLDARKEKKAKQAALNKKRAEAEKKQQKLAELRDSALVEGDLAYALAILKKNGLKIITVDEKAKKEVMSNK